MSIPKHRNTLALRHAVKAALLMTMVTQAAHGEAVNGKLHFDIPAQSLNQALMTFGKQSRQQLMYSTDIAENFKSHALQGDYTAAEAIEILLGDSPLRSITTGEGTITLQPKAKDMQNKADTKVLAPVKVTGYAAKDVNAPDNKDYKITNAVTATKTDTPIMQTPMSVKVVPQQVMKDQQVITVDQALRNVSGAVSGVGGSGTFFLRGFGNYNVYRDGYLNQSQWAHTEDLANVERVEVLKGPGSILYGRTEPGGLVNFVTKQPLDTPYYSLNQQFGSFDLYRTNVDATGPLTANKDLAYRFNLGYQSNNTFQEFGSEERLFVAPSLRWNISDKTSSTLKVEYSDIKENGRGMVPIVGNRPANIPRERNLGDPWNLQEDEYVMVSLNTEHAFNDAWKLRHRFNFTNHVLTMTGRLAPAGGPGRTFLPNGNIFRAFFAQNIDGDDYQHNFFNALELTGKFNTGFAKHTLLVGGDYYRSDYRSTWAGFTLATRDSSNLFNPVHQSGPPAILPGTIETGNFSLPWFGLYAQDQVELPYNVHLLAGLRYDNAESSGTSSAGPVQDSSYDKVSPRGGIVWQPIPELSLYGSYTENFGAPNNFWANTAPLPPQTAEQWETGIKTELFGGRFSGTVAYFDLTKQNLPVMVDARTMRAIGEAESRGIETDFTGEILPGWNVIGAYAYTPFAKTLKDSIGAGTEGMRLHNAPVNSGSLWTTYEFQQPVLHGLKVGAGMQAVGQREIGYDETAQAPGYVTANLMVSKLWKVGASRLTTQLNVDNLLDKTYTASTQSSGLSSYGAPRTFMGAIKIEY
ncbi:TonB-dependent receptor [Methylobacter sp. Wu8]|uniref:TonB-dependent siderophore receptor n=1 Tax=Methylobacter sp. Wu8 TaxID=3118457 RepID=UPI002F34690B|nr:TonB-dependent receptor [Methylobacter tundripaludum]